MWCVYFNRDTIPMQTYKGQTQAKYLLTNLFNHNPLASYIIISK